MLKYYLNRFKILPALILVTLISLCYLWEHSNLNNKPEIHKVVCYSAVSILNNNNNYYFFKGTVNNHPVVFLIDTGSSYVVIPHKMASKLKLTDSSKEKVILHTSNGSVNTQATRLNTLTIGNITLNNVQAIIGPGMYDNIIILGMTALDQINFVQQNNKMTLTAR